MMTPVVIVGAGGFGRHVLDVIDAINTVEPTYELLGFLDDGEVDQDLLGGGCASVLGNVSALEHLAKDVQYIIGIGVGRVRSRIDQWASSIGREAFTAIHPNVSVGRQVKIEPGVVICSHTSIGSHVTLGRHVHLNFNCSVGHDSVLHEYVTAYPGANIAGNVELGADSTIGTGASVIQGIRVGARSFVGAGAAVIRDVSEDVVEVGVPARPKRSLPKQDQ